MSPLGERQREPGIARLQAVGGCQILLALKDGDSSYATWKVGS
jgi:hypothetical protein